ncbi:MAG TPA: hypothetical protein VJO12_01495 [Stellaceae bacterium]|nr:hypothetical protein [Stellaceae bacterium]
MSLRWPVSLVLALLVTASLAVGIAAGIQALVPLMASEPPPWLEPWLPAASLAALLFGPIVMMVRAYRRRRAKIIPAKRD